VLTLLALVATCGVFAWFARTLPWTRPAVASWCAALVTLLWLQARPGRPPNIAAICVWLAVALLFLPDRSPLRAWGSAAERRCHEVMHRVSREAREAHLAGRLGEVLAGLVADLEALDPPDGPWRPARAAQLLDLRGRPPQVGVGDSTDRLAPWPWRVALDRRIVRPRVWLDDAVRRRRAGRLDRPGWDDLPSDQRYDAFFLRVLTARFLRLQDGAGGLEAAAPEGAALISLAREVGAPDAGWARVRDLVVERLDLELRGATVGLAPEELDRLRAVAEESVALWGQLEEGSQPRLASRP
jgi:hypothetical protein